ncbi:MAG: ABC transporter permease [Desulfotignum sp.]|nr:ABC transporter permease [Desulfotignum sp.]MCF8137165.1 ABC transporter permease [Desulfotignum sp.]
MDFVTIPQLAFSGLTIGCVYSLVGLGFALTLRATELINFAQGEMVMLGAFIGLTLISFFHLPYIMVFILSIILTGIFGMFMERFILRRILDNKSPLLNLLIATLGISISLQALAIILWGREPVPYPDIFSVEPVMFFGIRLQHLNLWILCLGLASMAALQFFFQKTMTGISWRAASLDPSTAALYGVNRQRNVSLTFALSGALGGGAGVLIAPLYFASFGMGHSVLVKSFAAAAMGGFGVVGTMIGGLALGAIETLAAGLISSEYKNVIMYVILLAVLMVFFRPKTPTGRSITEGSKVAAGRAVNLFSADMPFWIRPSALLLGAAVWLIIPAVFDVYTMRILNLALIFAVAALGLQLIVGYTGQFSFGHAAFFGIGAYTSALLAIQLNLPFLLTLPLAGAAAGLVGWLAGPLLRLSGHFLAIGSLAMGEIIFLLMLNWKWLTKGAYGLYGIPFPSIFGFEISSDYAYYFLVTMVLGLICFLVHRLTDSRFGRGLIAVRENELAAMVNGINLISQKTKAFVIGTACAGIAGALYAHYVTYINPDSFQFHVSVEMVTMVVIGGLGSVPGSLIGALVIILLPEYLRGLADYRLVVYGGLLIGFMMYLPGGLADLARYPLRILRQRLQKNVREVTQ